MTDIAPIQRTPAARYAEAAQFARRDDEAPAPSVHRENDQVEVSFVATYLSKLRELPIRQDLVDRVKQEIASGTYESPEKVSGAADEILKDL